MNVVGRVREGILILRCSGRRDGQEEEEPAGRGTMSGEGVDYT